MKQYKVNSGKSLIFGLETELGCEPNDGGIVLFGECKNKIEYKLVY